MISLGTYPEVSLKQARDRQDEIRRDLAQGIAPGKKIAAPSSRFSDVCAEWLEKKHQECVPSYMNKLHVRLEKYVLPKLSGKACQDITAQDVLALARVAEKQGNIETAHRVVNIIGQVLRYAVVTGRIERDVTRDLTRALPPPRVQHFDTVLDEADIARLLADIEAYTGHFQVRQALRIAPHIFVRPGELRNMQWTQIVGDEWRFTLSKTSREHIVPLSRQVLGLLDETRQAFGDGPYVFPGLRLADAGKRPISDMALLSALRRMGWETQTIHGFRAMARTLLDEKLHFRPELIEHQLGHVVRDPLGRAYNRTQHLSERREMMQAWSDWLGGRHRGLEISQADLA
jgi:integrase